MSLNTTGLTDLALIRPCACTCAHSCPTTPPPVSAPVSLQPAWRHADGTWQPAHANFTSLATPNQLGSGKTALETLLHEGGHAAHFANVDQHSPFFSQVRHSSTVWQGSGRSTGQGFGAKKAQDLGRGIVCAVAYIVCMPYLCWPASAVCAWSSSHIYRTRAGSALTAYTPCPCLP